MGGCLWRLQLGLGQGNGHSPRINQSKEGVSAQEKAMAFVKLAEKRDGILGLEVGRRGHSAMRQSPLAGCGEACPQLQHYGF